jgi:hypothetical protein
MTIYDTTITGICKTWTQKIMHILTRTELVLSDKKRLDFYTLLFLCTVKRHSAVQQSDDHICLVIASYSRNMSWNIYKNRLSGVQQIIREALHSEDSTQCTHARTYTHSWYVYVYIYIYIYIYQEYTYVCTYTLTHMHICICTPATIHTLTYWTYKQNRQ